MKNENDATQPPANAEQQPAQLEPALDSEDFPLPQPQHCDMDICESCQ